MSGKFAFYLSLATLIFGCLVILDLSLGEGAVGWFFTIGVVGSLVSVPLSVVLELFAA